MEDWINLAGEISSGSWDNAAHALLSCGTEKDIRSDFLGKPLYTKEEVSGILLMFQTVKVILQRSPACKRRGIKARMLATLEPDADYWTEGDYEGEVWEVWTRRRVETMIAQFGL